MLLTHRPTMKDFSPQRIVSQSTSGESPLVSSSKNVEQLLHCCIDYSYDIYLGSYLVGTRLPQISSCIQPCSAAEQGPSRHLANSIFSLHPVRQQRSCWWANDDRKRLSHRDNLYLLPIILVAIERIARLIAELLRSVSKLFCMQLPNLIKLAT